MAWDLKPGDLKRYPHFDKYLPIHKILDIVSNPERVRANAFYPFIRYMKSYQPFRGKNSRPDKKQRPIRYASRRDAYTFAYYRHLISERYEAELARLGLQNCVIAYRKVPVDKTSNRGKCNINFAKDAIDFIKSIQECSALVLDISKYFESLDHELLREIWCRLFGFPALPPDHAAVFKNVTNYTSGWLL